MSKFAKVFDLPDGGQVLVTLGVNSDDENYELIIRTDIEGTEASVALGFSSKESGEKALDEYSLDHAMSLREQVKGLTNEV